MADKRMLGGRGTLEQEGREGFEQEVEGSILHPKLGVNDSRPLERFANSK